jgi:diguanylate cyclase (GGDEF)-like protein
VARYGGEEFVIILPNTDMNGGEVIAEKLREGVEALGIIHSSSQASGRVTISLGVATAMPSQNFSPSELVAAADQALYLAKQVGRNKVKSSNLMAEEVHGTRLMSVWAACY